MSMRKGMGRGGGIASIRIFDYETERRPSGHDRDHRFRCDVCGGVPEGTPLSEFAVERSAKLLLLLHGWDEDSLPQIMWCRLNRDAVIWGH